MRKIMAYGSWLAGAAMAGVIGYAVIRSYQIETGEGMKNAREILEKERTQNTNLEQRAESNKQSQIKIPTIPIPEIPKIKPEEIKTIPQTPAEQLRNEGFSNNNYSIPTNTSPLEVTANNPVVTNTPVHELVPRKINNLVSDSFFEDSNYLTEEQIGKFLEAKGSCLKKYKAEKTIAQAAKDYQINPILILSRLQTEQGLVEKKHATKRQLRYATGYGALDNGKRLPSSGLRSQIINAADALRKHFDQFEGEEIKLDYGKIGVTPKNAATYACLKYTPHTSGAKMNAEIIRSYIGLAKDFKTTSVYAQAPTEVSND